MKKPAIIIDIDGTLSDCEHRRHYVSNGNKNWDKFLDPEEIIKDSPNKWCLNLSKLFWYHYHLLFVTGRHEKTREITNIWLHQHLIGNISVKTLKLFMRKDGDFRQDCIVKEEIYREHIEPYYDILFCIDDRKQVVDMWRRLGLVCLHCAEGDF